MKVDIQSLGTFSQLAHDGAREAATSLEQLAGIRTTVDATTIDLASLDDVITDFQGREHVGVSVTFEGAFTGTALLSFDRAGSRTLVKNLPGASPDSADGIQSRIEEVGNILISGFIDGWADHLDTTIDISPPTFRQGSGSEVLPEEAVLGDTSEQAFSFNSILETSSASINAAVYLFPERESLRSILTGELAAESTPIPLENIQVFNRMTARGTEQASENITMMTGTDTSVEVSRLRFLRIEQATSNLNEQPYVGVVFSLKGIPSGFLLILFDEQSAGAITEKMGAGKPEQGFGEIQQSAIEEIGNIMCSGFIDGWANVLDTSISHTPPEFVNDYAEAIMDPVIAQLAKDQQYTFVFDSLIETTDQAISCEIFALPKEAELKDALSRLDLDNDNLRDEDALAAAMTADPDDII